jgi:diguanylate cyclase (GGDEF)-like protein
VSLTQLWRLAQQGHLVSTYRGDQEIEDYVLQDVFYASFYLLAIIALDVRPHLRSRADDQDSMEVLRHSGPVIFAFGLLTYVILVPAAADPNSYWTDTTSFLLYVLLDAYVILRVAQNLASTRDGLWKLVYGWLLATWILWLILDTYETLLWADILPWIEPGTPLDFAWSIPYLTLIGAARIRAYVPPSPERSRPIASRTWQQLLLPNSPPILLVVIFPFVHFILYGLETYDDSMRQIHELLTLGLILILGGIVLAYQYALERSNARLEIDRREALARIEHQAHHDPLTTLPNRRLLQDRFAQATAQADRRQEGIALLYIDLNGFKRINDLHGHTVGDKILRRAAQRLSSRVRSSDTLARVGGDEFVIMATGIDDLEDVIEIAEQINSSLDDPFEIEGHPLEVTASIGTSFYPQDGDSLSQLLRKADEAMYQDKLDRSRTEQ